MKKLQDRLSAIEARLRQRSVTEHAATAERLWQELRRQHERHTEEPPQTWAGWAASAPTWDEVVDRVKLVAAFKRIVGGLPRFSPENATELRRKGGDN